MGDETGEPKFISVLEIVSFKEMFRAEHLKFLRRWQLQPRRMEDEHTGADGNGHKGGHQIVAKVKDQLENNLIEFQLRKDGSAFEHFSIVGQFVVVIVDSLRIEPRQTGTDTKIFR